MIEFVIRFQGRHNGEEVILNNFKVPISLNLKDNALKNKLLLLANEGISYELLKDFRNISNHYEITKFMGFLNILSVLKEIFVDVVQDNKIIAVLRYCDLDVFNPKIIPPQIILSKYAYIRNVNSCLVLENPLNETQIEIYDEIILRLIYSLSTEKSTSNISRLDFLDFKSSQKLVNVFFNLNILVNTKQDDQDIKNNVAFWEFHDLLFHSRTRPGYHKYKSGATFNRINLLEKTSAIRNSPTGPIIQLPFHSRDEIREKDHILSDVLENRRSIRKYGLELICLDQISEFLYRTFHIKELLNDNRGLVTYERISSVSPSAGGCSELEPYLLINKADGLTTGIYYYNREKHQLIFLNEINQKSLNAISFARKAAGLEEDPHILIILTARFGRIFWKYDSVGYSLILKNVGAVYQTMYLVATSMGLSPCALGGGPHAFLSDILDKDFRDESAVGEFLLGPHH